MSAGIFNEGRLAALPEEVCEYLRPMLDFEHQKMSERIKRFESIYKLIPKPTSHVSNWVDWFDARVELPTRWCLGYELEVIGSTQEVHVNVYHKYEAWKYDENLRRQRTPTKCIWKQRTFHCECCDAIYRGKQSWKRHLQTAKHQTNKVHPRSTLTDRHEWLDPERDGYVLSNFYFQNLRW